MTHTLTLKGMIIYLLVLLIINAVLIGLIMKLSGATEPYWYTVPLATIALCIISVCGVYTYYFLKDRKQEK